MNVPIESRGKICTIKRVAVAVISVISYSDLAPDIKEDPQSFCGREELGSDVVMGQYEDLR
jgi:hypothetical protein